MKESCGSHALGKLTRPLARPSLALPENKIVNPSRVGQQGRSSPSRDLTAQVLRALGPESELRSLPFGDEASFGSKTAKLAQLSYIASRLQGGVEIKVPEFIGISHAEIWNAVFGSHPDIMDLWQSFVSAQGEVTTGLTPDACHRLEFLRHRILSLPLDLAMVEILSPWLTKLRASGRRLMVRSTGREDSRDSANAGGNLSVANVLSEDEYVTDAVKQVIASYFSEKSMEQRLSVGDDITQPPFVPVLLQEMIGETSDQARPPISGVMFTREPHGMTPGITCIQTAYGHNEAIVSATCPVDSYFVAPDMAFACEDKFIHKVIVPKDGRLVPDEASGLLTMVPNPRRLKYESSAEEGVIRRLDEVGRILERFYGLPQDVEFTYQPHLNCIYLVQTRPIVIDSARAVPSEPSYVNRGACLDLASHKGTVIVGGQSQVGLIRHRHQLVVGKTIGEALDAYLALPDKSNIQAAIVGTDAPATSHWATQFRSVGVPVIWADAELVSGWLSQGAFLLLDTQTGDVFSLPTERVPAGDDHGVFGYLFSQELIKYGNTKHPIPERLTIQGSVLTERQMRRFVGRLAELCLIKGDLGTSDRPPSESLALLFAKLDQTSSMKQAATTEIMDLLCRDPSPSVRAQALAFLLRRTFVAVSKTQGAERERIVQVFQQLVGEGYQFIEALALGDENRVLVALNWFRGVFQQTATTDVVRADSLVGVLAESSQSPASSAWIQPSNHIREIQLLAKRLGRFAMRPRVKESWNRFVDGLSYLSEERANELAELLVEVQKAGIGPLWLNTVFSKAWANSGGMNPLRWLMPTDYVLPDLRQKFDQTLEDRSDLSAARVAIKNFQRHSNRWGVPELFPEIMSEVKTELMPALLRLSSLAESADPLIQMMLVRVLIEGVEAMDASIKSLMGTPSYGADLHTKARHVSAALEPYQQLMNHWCRIAPPPAGDRSIEGYVGTLAKVAKELQVKSDDKRFAQGLLRPSRAFNVNASQIDARTNIHRHLPQSLEDLFTLIHQNLLGAGARITLARGLPRADLPLEVAKVANALEGSWSLKDLFAFFVIKPTLTAVAYDYPQVTLTFNAPLGNHSAKIIVEAELDGAGNVKNQQLTMELYGDNRSLRLNKGIALAGLCGWMNGLKISTSRPPFACSIRKTATITFELPKGRKLDQCLGTLRGDIVMALDSLFGRDEADQFTLVKRRYSGFRCDNIPKVMIEMMPWMALYWNYKLLPPNLLKTAVLEAFRRKDSVLISTFEEKLESLSWNESEGAIIFEGLVATCADDCWDACNYRRFLSLAQKFGEVAGRKEMAWGILKSTMYIPDITPIKMFVEAGVIEDTLAFAQEILTKVESDDDSGRVVRNLIAATLIHRPLPQDLIDRMIATVIHLATTAPYRIEDLMADLPRWVRTRDSHLVDEIAKLAVSMELVKYARLCLNLADPKALEMCRVKAEVQSIALEKVDQLRMDTSAKYESIPIWIEIAQLVGGLDERQQAAARAWCLPLAFKSVADGNPNALFWILAARQLGAGADVAELAERFTDIVIEQKLSPFPGSGWVKRALTQLGPFQPHKERLTKLASEAAASFYLVTSQLETAQLFGSLSQDLSAYSVLINKLEKLDPKDPNREELLAAIGMFAAE